MAFLAGTLVHINDVCPVPIQDIKVGDMVLSKPENGAGDNEYKPVLNTFVHQDKPIWVLKANKTYGNDKGGNKFDKEYYDFCEETIHYLVTPNHPVLVIGTDVTEPTKTTLSQPAQFYDKPIWKRVDELERNDLLLSSIGGYYTVERAQPVYRYASHQQSKNGELDPNLYWYQKHYYDEFEAYWQDYYYNEDVKPDFSITKEDMADEYHNTGYLLNINDYIKDKGHISEEFTPTDFNWLKDAQGNHIPFTHDVHNLEVADNHTYYTGGIRAGLLVHNTSSPAQVLLQTARNIANS